MSFRLWSPWWERLRNAAEGRRCGRRRTETVEPTLPHPRLTSVPAEWVPICARYEIVGGTGEGIGQIRASEISEEGTLPKIPGRDSKKFSMRRTILKWDSGHETPGTIFRPGLPGKMERGIL